jgi:UTP--glucose-1-phosphate uridylyltransferase
VSAQESAAPHGCQVRKAVIPLAGLGTRLLPATKAVPKGMLPLIDKPVVQYVVEEAAAAGLRDVLLVIGGGQESFGRHFGLGPPLAGRGHRETPSGLAGPAGQVRVSSVTQDVPRGLGDAVLRGAGFAGAEPFAVLLGDNVLPGSGDLLATMIAARNKHGGTVVALTEVPRREVTSRAVVSFEPTADPAVVRITDVVEKPSERDAPSSWIMIGRFICDPAIFQVLAGTPAGHGGEIQLSDALRTLAATSPGRGGGVRGVFFRGRRLDTGNTGDYVRATVELACSRPDIAGEFLPWLRRYARTPGWHDELAP